MDKHINHKRNKKNKKAKPAFKSNNIPPKQAETPNIKNWGWSFIINLLRKVPLKVYILCTIAATFLTILASWPAFRDIFKSKTERFHDKHYIDGIFLPDILSPNRDSSIIIKFGGNVMHKSISEFKEGTSIPLGGVVTSDIDHITEPPRSIFDMSLKIINQRLYVKLLIKDIDKEEYVGEIDYDEWHLFGDNTLDFEYSDKALEIIDHAQQIAFNIQYQYPNTITIQGYYFTPYFYFVISNNGLLTFTKDNKKGAIDAIKGIQHIFDHKKKI